ncbi:hypothetical protein F4703DRAFT_1152555 [Phycomyces blakesleeanus]
MSLDYSNRTADHQPEDVEEGEISKDNVPYSNSLNSITAISQAAVQNHYHSLPTNGNAHSVNNQINPSGAVGTFKRQTHQNALSDAKRSSCPDNARLPLDDLSSKRNGDSPSRKRVRMENNTSDDPFEEYERLSRRQRQGGSSRSRSRDSSALYDDRDGSPADASRRLLARQEPSRNRSPSWHRTDDRRSLSPRESRPRRRSSKDELDDRRPHRRRESVTQDTYETKRSSDRRRSPPPQRWYERREEGSRGREDPAHLSARPVDKSIKPSRPSKYDEPQRRQDEPRRHDEPRKQQGRSTATIESASERQKKEVPKSTPKTEDNPIEFEIKDEDEKQKEEDRLIEERRKRRQAILNRHKSQPVVVAAPPISTIPPPSQSSKCYYYLSN